MTKKGLLCSVMSSSHFESMMNARMDESLQDPATVEPNKNNEGDTGENFASVENQGIQEITENVTMKVTTRNSLVSSGACFHEEFQSAVVPVEAITKLEEEGYTALAGNYAAVTQARSCSPSEQSQTREPKALYRD